MPRIPPHRELYNFCPLEPCPRDPSNPSSFLIPLTATPSPSAASQIYHQRQPPWTVWCVQSAPERTPLRNGLPRPPPSPMPTGKYSLTNLYKHGTPRFVSVPSKLIPPSQTPSSQTAQPSPPIRESAPQPHSPIPRLPPPAATLHETPRRSALGSRSRLHQTRLPQTSCLLNARLLQHTANSAHAASQLAVTGLRPALKRATAQAC